MAELADDLVPDQDARLDQAEGLVRRYCGWHIAPSRTETFTLPEAAPYIVLPTLHLTAVTAIVDADATDLLANGYTFSPEGVLRRGSYAQAGISYLSTWWPGGTVVTFTHGYVDVPPEITGVVQAIAQRAVDNPRSLVSTQDGPFSDTYSQTGTGETLALGLLAGEKVALDMYRLRSRP